MNLSHNLASILTAEELQLLEKRNLLTPLEKILDRYSRNFANFAITKGQLKSLFGLENRDLEDPSETQNELEVQLFDEVDYGLDSLDIGFENLGQSLNLKKNNDPISSMFDIYLDNSQLAPSIDYQANSWQIREIDWTNCNFLDECVILYRTHSQSRTLEEAFLKHKLPYRLVSGIRFLDRKEIKDVLSMLRFLANGDDKLALNRFLPLVMDGVGAKTLEKILLFLEDPEYPLAAKYQEQIMSLLEKLQKTWLKHTTLTALTKELLIITGYENYLKSEHPDKKEFEQKMENIAELYSIMLPFDQEKDLDLVGKLAAFLSQVLLMSQAETKDSEIEKAPKINLMTLHQCKGLEFQTVFLVGCEDGLLPHQNSFLEKKEMDEEVRLAYVGVTRSKENLHLTAAQTRIQFGQIKANPVSRIFRPFLDKYCQKVRN
jgi:superfamily I DNA/RNA helicase